MIKAKDLVGKVNEGRQCVSFQYWLKNDNSELVKILHYVYTGKAWFVMSIEDGVTWQDCIDEVTYGSLVNVAANGLLKLQSYLERRVQDDQEACYCISNATRGM